MMVTGKVMQIQGLFSRLVNILHLIRRSYFASSSPFARGMAAKCMKTKGTPASRGVGVGGGPGGGCRLAYVYVGNSEVVGGNGEAGL